MTGSNKTKKKIPVVLPLKYSNICKEINTYWPDIEQDELQHTTFPEKPMLAHKKNKTLANILVRSKIIGNEPNRPLLNSRPPRRDQPPTVTLTIDNLLPKGLPMTKHNHRHCQICPRMILASSIYSRGLHYNIR